MEMWGFRERFIKSCVVHADYDLLSVALVPFWSSIGDIPNCFLPENDAVFYLFGFGRYCSDFHLPASKMLPVTSILQECRDGGEIEEAIKFIFSVSWSVSGPFVRNSCTDLREAKDFALRMSIMQGIVASRCSIEVVEKVGRHSLNIDDERGLHVVSFTETMHSTRQGYCHVKTHRRRGTNRRLDFEAEKRDVVRREVPEGKAPPSQEVGMRRITDTLFSTYFRPGRPGYYQENLFLSL